MTFKPLYWTFALLTLAGVVGLTLAGGANARRPAAKRPNIIFVLTDDLAWNLVKYMPHVKQLRARGTTFTNYFVTDSLCCPSRASTFTGQYPHDTGIFTNGGDDGGFALFHARGEESHTFATRLQGRGYRTALMGKYLNGYKPAARVDGKLHLHPARLERVGRGRQRLLGVQLQPQRERQARPLRLAVRARTSPTSLARKGSAFVHSAAASRKPFFLEIATFAPHGPYTPAPRDAGDFPRLQAPRTPAFNEEDLLDKPSWLRDHPFMTPTQITEDDTAFRKRAQAVEAVDDLIAKLEKTLERNGVADNTYIFFSSDNGFHMGDHRLLAGKLTAFETDIHVPLVVAGPHVRAGRDVARVTENIDLCPTFVHLGGAGTMPGADGANLGPLLRRKAGALLARRRARRAPRAGLRGRSRAGCAATRQRESDDVRGAPAAGTPCTWSTRTASVSTTTSTRIRTS